MRGLRLGLGIGASRAGDPPIITQDAATTFGPYTAGMRPTEGYIAGTYASSAGTISSAVPSWTVNGTAAVGSEDLVDGDVVGLTVLVTDSVANTRVFNYGTQTVAAPIITETTPPTFGPYVAGDTPISEYADGVYASTAGTISTIIEAWEINAVSATGSETLIADDEITLTVTVTDSAANDRTFSYGTVVVAAGVPADTTPPEMTAFSFSDPIASATVNEAGKVWYLISNSATPMTGAAIKAAVQAMTPDIYGDFTVAASTDTDEAIDTTGLAPGTWYLHAAPEDAAGNVAVDGDVVSFVAVAPGWNLAGASYMSKTFDLSGKDAAPAGMYISPDGLRLYFIGTTNDDLHQYDIGTAWDISTASFVRTFDSSPDEITPSAVFFKNDGTRCYILGNSGNEINEYTLGTAWNISTCTLNHTFSLTATETTPQGIFFRDDGLKMYTIGQAGDAVDEFTLSSAWVLSSASYVDTGVVVSQEASTTGLFFKDDGTKLYVIGTTGQAVFQYTLSTPWDITTRSYDSVSFSVASETTTPQCVVFGDSGQKFYILSNTGPIYQYEAV